MKSLIAALSFAVVTGPVFADDRGAPYEQSQVERGIVDQRLPHGTAASGASAAAPRGGASPWASGPWANDWNFIAPAL